MAGGQSAPSGGGSGNPILPVLKKYNLSPARGYFAASPGHLFGAGVLFNIGPETYEVTDGSGAAPGNIEIDASAYGLPAKARLKLSDNIASIVDGVQILLSDKVFEFDDDSEVSEGAVAIGLELCGATRAAANLNLGGVGQGQRSDGDTIVVNKIGGGSSTYTFKNTVEYTLKANEVAIGIDVLATMTNLKAAMNHEAGEGTLYGTGTTPHPDYYVGLQNMETDGNLYIWARHVGSTYNGPTVELTGTTPQTVPTANGQDVFNPDSLFVNVWSIIAAASPAGVDVANGNANNEGIYIPTTAKGPAADDTVACSADSPLAWFEDDGLTPTDYLTGGSLSVDVSNLLPLLGAAIAASSTLFENGVQISPSGLTGQSFKTKAKGAALNGVYSLSCSDGEVVTNAGGKMIDAHDQDAGQAGEMVASLYGDNGEGGIPAGEVSVAIQIFDGTSGLWSTMYGFSWYRPDYIAW